MLASHIRARVQLGLTRALTSPKRTTAVPPTFAYPNANKAMCRKRIFLLHPSHHHSLSTAALPTLSAYETPLSSSPLPLDVETIQRLLNLTTTTSNGRLIKFTTMSASVDEAEHSAEMQLPYIHRLLQKLYPDRPNAEYPPLVPIMVGSTNPATEVALGKILAPYIAEESNAFVISSDFCHWGSRFSYTYYLPGAPTPSISPLTLPNGVKATGGVKDTSADDVHRLSTLDKGISLRSSTKLSRSGPKIYESISHVDRACMSAIATGRHDQFLKTLYDTGNTVCGRHPIGVFLAGVEEVEKIWRERAENDAAVEARFKFVRYERSSDVESSRDSSVSYVSAFAVL